MDFTVGKTKLTPRPGVPSRTEIGALIAKINADRKAFETELDYINEDPSPAKIPVLPKWEGADRAGHRVKKFDLDQNI